MTRPQKALSIADVKAKTSRLARVVISYKSHGDDTVLMSVVMARFYKADV